MKSKSFFATAIAIAIMFLQLIVPSTLHSREEMQSARKGFPVNFVQQDITAIDFSVPHLYRFSSPWENPTEFLWLGLVIDFVIFYIPVFLFLKLLAGRGAAQSKNDGAA